MGRLLPLLLVVCFALVFSARSNEKKLAVLLEDEDSFSNFTSIDGENQSEVIGAAKKTERILNIITAATHHWSYKCAMYRSAYQEGEFIPDRNKVEQQTFSRLTREAPQGAAVEILDEAAGEIQISWKWKHPLMPGNQEVLLTVRLVSSMTSEVHDVLSIQGVTTQRQRIDSDGFQFYLGEVPAIFAGNIASFFVDTGDQGKTKVDPDDGVVEHAGYDRDCSEIICDAVSAQCCFDFYLVGEFHQNQNENDVRNLKLEARRRKQTDVYIMNIRRSPDLFMPWTSTPIYLVD